MGVHVPLITPFDAAGAVALDALEALAHEVLDEGASGLVALGTTAEPGALRVDERAAVLDVVHGVCAARKVPLTVGTEDPSTLSRYPAATAALCLVPPFVRAGEDGVLAYFEALAARSPVPVLVYHVPLRTGQELSTAALRRLAAVDGITGVKYAPTVIDADAVDLLTAPPPGWAVLAATDPLLAPMLALGAHGAILASALVDTASYAALTAGAAPGLRGGAVFDRAEAHRLARLSTALFAEPNPTVIKGVLHAQGRIPTPSVRLPLLPAARSRVDAALTLADLAVVVGA
ncbi:4-hydroxy-tetrahydrodipicolinate synthase [Virgisporangium aliadipatigenens]|uniref:4-hydroxy-tetrahydrodipicolinate synthase n=1 Tax=Virgisporangium aliadipatigenens TaxID=741659 RepID=A0A8J4DTN1_9ACTN|nr:dihydrodipicolinate synthase family protein [Virgisporangium aliadipatigenens]GIJ48387.1 4-hydroxy-tetrahydrodipicolinate synthase [Virgisporangium aliadipatigenens]